MRRHRAAAERGSGRSHDRRACGLPGRVDTRRHRLLPCRHSV